jgi:RNA polymerase primary sigma factor
MLRKRDVLAVAELAALSRERRHLPLRELDQFLTVDKAFDARVDALIERLGDLPLELGLGRPMALLPTVERDRIRTINDDDVLRPYLRDLGRIQRMEKAEEIASGKRLEFIRRRFQRAATAAGLGRSEVRQITRPGGRGSPEAAAGRTPRDLAAAERMGRIRRLCGELNAMRAEFVERNLHLVVGLAISYRTYGVPILDLIQEGNAALIRAVEKFDWRKNVRFQTYATFWIRQAVERAIAFNRGIVRVPNYLQQKMRRLRREGVIPRRDGDVTLKDMSRAFEIKPEIASHLLETERGHFSLDAKLDEDGESFAAFLADETQDREVESLEFPMLRERLHQVMETLTPQERRILELRYGLGGVDPLTLEEVGKQMKVSRERIRQLQVRAIRKLQRPTLIDKLTGFV